MLFSVLPTLLFADSNKVIISEFMAVNSNGIIDEDLEHSDWLELYNNSAGTIDLGGWFLTDDAANLKKWQFPAVSLPKGAYLVIFASGKNRIDPSKKLHTNFKLSGSGEFLAISEPDSTISCSFSPMFPAQRQDVSYGFYQGQAVYFTTATPGAENVAGSLPFAPTFSVARGFYNAPIDVVLSLSGGNGSIYYTLDGTRPTLATGTLYSTPIHITTTTPLSAVTINSAGLLSEVITNTYIYPADVVKQSSTPVGYPTDWKQAASTTTIKADYEMDPDICNSADYKSLMENSLKSIPTVSIVTNAGYIFSDVNNATTGGIYIYTGRPLSLGADWVRPTSAEYFDPATGKQFQINCELKLHGGNSRIPANCMKHGFELGFKSAYGPSKLNFDVFEEKNAVKEFNSLVLRGGYNYTWAKNAASQQIAAQYIQDSWAKTTQLEMGYPSAHERFVHLYINGLYWGLYNITEQYDEDFMESYLGGDKTQYDVVKEQQFTMPTAGTLVAWKDLLSQVQTDSIATNANYQKLKGRNPDGTLNVNYSNLLDIEDYIDYMLVNYYLGNQDWDKNNWSAGRNFVSNASGFKFFCWDAETTMTAIGTDLVSAAPTLGNPTAFLQFLKKNPDFKVTLADHIQKQLINDGGALTPKVVAERYTKLATEIDLAIIAESARWGDWYNNTGPYTKNGHWLPRKNALLTSYFPYRTDTVIKQLRKAGYFPTVNAPKFTNNGGTITSAISLGMSSNTGTIYYTTDGTDPRTLVAGTVAIQAKTYTNAFSVGSSITVKARAKTSTEWSAITEATFVYIGPNAVQLPLADLLACSNYPNPFGESTRIHMTLPADGDLQLDIYGIDGRLVRQLFKGKAFSGENQFDWSPETTQTGIYICRISYGGQSTYLKLIKK
ncbi:MAG: chitobiase/beta-hexosaminidase C-terminal domain-containing protein [Paludibacter sp.]|nr:chitobiase/beta-hexosaminidase C-terminal domain-containing protein [Paludibacter sp.]